MEIWDNNVKFKCCWWWFDMRKLVTSELTFRAWVFNWRIFKVLSGVLSFLLNPLDLLVFGPPIFKLYKVFKYFWWKLFNAEENLVIWEWIGKELLWLVMDKRSLVKRSWIPFVVKINEILDRSDTICIQSEHKVFDTWTKKNSPILVLKQLLFTNFQRKQWFIASLMVWILRMFKVLKVLENISAFKKSGKRLKRNKYWFIKSSFYFALLPT